MYRRDFIKLAGLGLFGIVLPKSAQAQIGVNEMELGDLLEKVANNVRLTPEELSSLKRIGNETQLRNKIIGGSVLSDGTYNLDRPTIISPHWKGSPLGNISIKADNVTIPTGVDTDISFEAIFGTSEYFRPDPLDSKKIIVTYPGYTFQVTGVVQFAANSTGYRNAHIVGFDKSDNVVFDLGLNHVTANASPNVTLFPVSYMMNFAEIEGLSYFKMRVAQGSGADLNLDVISISVYVV